MDRRNWRGEKLTEQYCPGQRFSSSSATPSTQSPNSWIRFDSSAMGMNVAGLIGPCSAVFQRSSASNPSIASASRVTIG